MFGSSMASACYAGSVPPPHHPHSSVQVLLTASGAAKLANVGFARLQTATFLSTLNQIVGTFAWWVGGCGGLLPKLAVRGPVGLKALQRMAAHGMGTGMNMYEGCTQAARRSLAVTACLPLSRVAPEILQGQRASAAIDIYSFGIVLWVSALLHA